jgi:pyridoxine 4-dehydrogenase
LARSDVMVPIPGTSSVEHLEENLAAAELELTDAERDELEAAAG